MKILFVSLFILVIVIVSALMAHRDPGYVLIGHGDTILELSLSLFIILILLTLVAGYAFLRLILNTLSMPKQIQRWQRNYQARKARAASNSGLIALAQGYWQEAEKMLTKYATHSDTPLLNYLSAAHAAQKLNAPQRRDKYFIFGALKYARCRFCR